MAIVVKPRDIWGALGSGLGSGFSQGVLRMMMDKLDQEKEKRRFNEQAFTSGYTPVDVPSETMHGAEFPGQPPEGAVKGPHGGYWTPPQTKKGWSTPKKAGKNNEYGLPEGTVYQVSPEGKAETIFEPEKIKRPYQTGQQIITKIGDETTAQVIAGFDKNGIPFDTEGNTIKTGTAKTKPGYEMITEYGPNGQTRRVPVLKGVKYIPSPGWSLKSPTETKPEYTPGKALTRISTIKKAMAELDKTNEITKAIVAANPGLQGMFGQSMDEQLKQDLMDAWQDELDYLSEFVPKKKNQPKTDKKNINSKQKAIDILRENNKPVTEANITYIMDQLE